MQDFKGKAVWAKAVLFAVMAMSASATMAQGEAVPADGPEDGGLSVSLGLGVSVMPEYAGSEDYKAAALPVVSASWGPFFADPLEGIGVRHMMESGTEVSLKMGQDFGRKEKDHSLFPGSDRLKGMGEIRSAVTASLELKQHLNDWLAVTGDYTTRLNRRDEGGDQYSFGVEVMPFPLLGVKSERSMLTLSLNAHGADRDFNQAYFGVTDAQSLRSGYRAHAMKSGIHAASLDVKWNYLFSPRWSMLLGAEAITYSSDVKDSPIVQSGTNYTATAAVMYTF
ncbi:MAG: MipA/OmpV family protein [Lautropia sp.]|nr:MipA/OmpV family protein [Lautropia sp.]